MVLVHGCAAGLLSSTWQQAASPCSGDACCLACACSMQWCRTGASSAPWDGTSGVQCISCGMPCHNSPAASCMCDIRSMHRGFRAAEFASAIACSWVRKVTSGASSLSVCNLGCCLHAGTTSLMVTCQSAWHSCRSTWTAMRSRLSSEQPAVVNSHQGSDWAAA